MPRPTAATRAGSPAEPKCGFSRRVVEALRAVDVRRTATTRAARFCGSARARILAKPHARCCARPRPPGQVPFGSFDILGDEAVRQGLKEHSNWPTYPQLYARGELLGGCDIVEELARSGELKAALAGGAAA